LHERSQPFPLLDSISGPIAILEISVFGTARRTGAQPAVQTTPTAAAYRGTLARRTSPRLCSTTCGSPQIPKSCLDILIHGVVRDFFTAPGPSPKQQQIISINSMIGDGTISALQGHVAFLTLAVIAIGAIRRPFVGIERLGACARIDRTKTRMLSEPYGLIVLIGLLIVLLIRPR
jgi:hypothetical protein